MLSNKSLIFQFLIFILSIGYLVTAFSLGNPISNSGLGPSFYPLLLGFFSVLFSSVLLFREASLIKSKMSDEGPLEKKANYSHLLIILSIFIYILLFTTVGYIISSILFVFSIIIIFSSLQKIIQKAIISIVIVTLGYLVFEQMFGIRLPVLWE